MFLKRSMVLVAGLFLFILGFIVYFHMQDAQMEEKFRQERLKFGVEGTVLTAADTNIISSPYAIPPPASSSTNTAANPAPSSAPDANTVVSPAPAPSSSTPDPTPAPFTLPAAPDPN